MSDEDLSIPGSGYHGRLWDAPMTDGMPQIDMLGATCSLCQEMIDEHDDAIRLMSDFHLACLLRSTMGDVNHLEGQCRCYGFRTPPDNRVEGTYREEAQRTLDWLIDHGKGRWAS